MGSQERDLLRIEVQLTVAKWHLHDAMRASADRAIHKLECARLAYAGIVRSLAEAKLTKKERRQIERELRVLQSRLDGGPVLPEDSLPEDSLPLEPDDESASDPVNAASGAPNSPTGD